MILKLLFIFLQFFCSILTFDDIPEIIVATQTSEQTIKLIWKVDKRSITNPTRYRILYTKDSQNGSFYEWPAQLKRVENLLNFEYERVIVTSSNFDCYNKCIKDENCKGAFRVYSKVNDENCYLITQNNTYNASNIASSNDYEYVELKDYSDSIEITNIPHNEVYRFKVSLYDEPSKTWSNFSSLSNIVNTTVDLDFNFERNGFSTGKIIVKQRSEFKNYIISKLFVSIIDMGFNLFVDKSLYTFSMEPNYYNQNFREITITDSQLECQNRCIETDNCISYAYFNEQNEIDNLDENTCALFEDFDLDTSVHKKNSSNVYFLRSNLSEIILDLENNHYYEFRLSGLTPYGTQIISPTIVFNNFTNSVYVNLNVTPIIEDLSIKLNWTIVNDAYFTDVSRFLLNIKEPHESDFYKEESTDFDDPNEEELDFSYIELCFKSCYNNPQCLAYTWNFDENKCKIKFSIDNPKECSENLKCFKIPKYSNELILKNNYVNRKYCFEITISTIQGYQSQKSNLECVEFFFNVSTNSVGEFIEGNSAHIECLNNKIDENLIKNITWIKDGSEENLNELLQYIEFFNNKLIFKNLTRNKFDGVYICNIILNQNQPIRSHNTVNIVVSYPVELKIESNLIVRYNESDTTNIICIADGSPKKDIVWKYIHNDNSTNIIKDVIYYNRTLTHNKLVMAIKNINKTNQGIYECSTEDETLSSRIKIIIQTLPSKPIIINGTIESDLTYFKWNVNYDGELNLTSILLEWSKNFSDNSISPYSKYFLLNELNKNEIYMDIKLPNVTYIRISVLNILGKSELSDEYLLKYIGKNEIPTSKTNNKYYTPFLIITICFAITIIIFIIGLFIYIRINKNKKHLNVPLVDMDEISLSST